MHYKGAQLLMQMHFSSAKKSDVESEAPQKKDVKVWIKSAMDSVLEVIFNPRKTWKIIKHEVNHYWTGSKLLWSEMKIASQILSNLLGGGGMTRRERIQLLRTTQDVFRLVPFSLFIIIPFMELLLPFALKLFPNMLPSTFEDQNKKKMSMRKELQMRLAVAEFMQETLKDMAQKKKRSLAGSSEEDAGAGELISFMDKARTGDAISNDDVVRIARLFKDELTLDNISRPQLVSMCRYMGLQPYGADVFLRFQLRVKLNSIKEDDRSILWEGIDSLNTLELREACRDRGMRSLDMTHFRLKKQLNEWLQLSIQKNIPISLMIMSRAFNITVEHDGDESAVAESAEDLLKRSMSSLDLDMVNEVVIAAATATEADTEEIQKRKLESLIFQKELMMEEKEMMKEKEMIKEKEKEEDKEKDKDKIKEKEKKKKNVSESERRQESVLSVEAKERISSAEASPEHSGAVILPPTAPSPSKKVADGESTSNLTIEEIEALCDLARGRALHKEKSALAVLRAALDTNETLEIENRSSVPAVTEAPTVMGATVSLLSSINSSINSAVGDSLKATLADKKVLALRSKMVNPIASSPVRQKEQAKAALPPQKQKQDDKSFSNMQSVLSSMLTKLQAKIDLTEVELRSEGDLRSLDLDGDGRK